MYLSAKLNAFKIISSAVVTLFFTAACVVFPEISKSGVSDGLNLCYTVLVPSLFPFLFSIDHLYSLLTYGKGGGKSTVIICFLFSLVGGFPVGAKLLSSCVKDGVISNKQAALLLPSFVNAGPAYLIGGVGGSLFGSAGAGTVLFFSLTLASVLFFIPAYIFLCREPFSPRRGTSPPDLVRSLSSAVSATVRLCSFVVLFSCIGGFISFFLSFLTSSGVAPWAALTLLEVTSACGIAAKAGSIQGLYLALISVSLCGVSVILQIRTFLKSVEIPLSPFLALRPLHALLSLAVARFALSVFPAAAVFRVIGGRRVSLFSFSPPVSLFILLAAVILVGGTRKNSRFTN